MLNAHVAQQLSTLRAAGGGVDLGPCRAGYGDRGLPDATGSGVDQHLVAGPDAGQVVQPVPGGGVRGGHRRGLGVGHAHWQRGGQARVTGDESGPAAVGGHAPDVVADLVVGDVGSDGRHDTGEIGTQLWQDAVEALVPAEREQNIGKVDARCGDSDFDLSGSRRNPVEGGELHCLQVTWHADLHTHSVALVDRDGGLPLFGAQRSRAQARRVPLVVAPRRLVFVRPDQQQLAHHLLGVGLLVNVDMRGVQVRVLGTDHPEQAAHGRLDRGWDGLRRAPSERSW